MADVQLSFQDAAPNPAAGNVTGYTGQWTHNGVPAGSFNIPAATGPYTRLFSQDNAGVTLANGDTVGCSVQSAVASTGLSSTPAVAAPITISIAPPPVPPNPPGGLVLTQV